MGLLKKECINLNMSEPLKELLELIETNRIISIEALSETIRIEEKELVRILPLENQTKKFPDNKSIMNIIQSLAENKTIKKQELKQFTTKFYEELERQGYSIIHVKQGRLARILVYMEKKGEIKIIT